MRTPVLLARMFTILGGDGKEYGPVTAEQIRAWIAAGRANLDTQARRDGETEWRRLGDFAEFATPTTPLMHDTLVAPEPPTADYRAYAADLISRAGKLDILGCFERSWTLLKSDFWPIVGVTAAVMILTFLLGTIPYLGKFVGLLLGGVFNAGLYFYYLKKLRGQTATLGDAFAGFGCQFGQLVLASIVSTLLTAAGFVLLILPGIYLAVSYAFVYILCIDKQLPFWESMEVSRRVVTAQWLRIFGLLLVSVLIVIAGALALGVGLFVAVPIVIGGFAVAYEHLCNPPRRG